ncbi:hypothetical protein ACFO9Q_03520 [Paenibacillus sp. GCM10023252]
MIIQILKSVRGMSGEMKQQFKQMTAAGYDRNDPTPLEGVEVRT